MYFTYSVISAVREIKRNTCLMLYKMDISIKIFTSNISYYYICLYILYRMARKKIALRWKQIIKPKDNNNALPSMR